MAKSDISLKPARRIWTVVFVLISLAVLAGGHWYFRTEAERIRKEKFQDLAAIGELKASGIAQWRAERLGDARNLAESPLLRKAIEEWLGKPSILVLRQDILKRLELTKEVFSYANVVLLDLDGQVLISVKEDPSPVGTDTREAMDEAVRSGKVVLTDLFRSPSGVICLDSVAPVLNAAGLPIGVLVLRSDAKAFLFPFIQSWPTPSQSAETLLVRREGEEVVCLNELRHRAGTALSFRYPLSRTMLPSVQAVLGKEGTLEGRDYRGVKVLADLRPVPGSAWSMVAKEDVTEVLAEMRYRAGITIVIVAFLILLAAAATSLGYRLRQAHLYSALYESERKHREIHEEMRTTLYSIGDAVITTDTKGQVKVMNPVAERLTGWSEAEAKGKPLEEVFHIINEETRAEAQNPVERVLREGVVVGLANHSVLVARDGREIPIADAGSPIHDEKGVITGVVLVFRDQTEERAAARALRANEERFRLASESVNDVIWEWDIASGRLNWYGDIDKLLGYASGEFPRTITAWEEIICPDDRARVMAALDRHLNAGAPYDEEYWVRRKDGSRCCWRDKGVSVRDQQGKAVRMIGSVSDITEHRRAEEALRASEEKYRILHEFAGEAIFTFGVDLKLMEINKTACDYVGAVREEVLGKDILELGILHPDDHTRAVGNIQKILSRTKPLVVDKLRFRGKHGLYGIFQVTSTPVIRDGEIVAVTNVSRDVTLEEQLYSTLEASERRYRFLFNAGNDAIFVYELTKDIKPGKYVEVNDLACMMMGYSREELFELSPLGLAVPEEKEQVYESQLFLSEKKHRVFERTFMTKDGRRIPSEVSSHLFELNGKPTVLAIVRDISERKKAEEALKSALKEKDIMLREIHHRVKNNMQIMSSLLRLQARQTSDEKAREALSESHTRIRSMAIIHEKLHQSKDFANIDFADYLEKMVTHLFAVYEVDAQRVRFKIDVRQIEMDINRAIPCGLIVNELVSNALKHAFPEGKEGELVIRMFRDESGKFDLVVKDTGCGFPESIDIQKPQTLGLQIVADLTKQLDGKLELSRDGGTEIHITF